MPDRPKVCPLCGGPIADLPVVEIGEWRLWPEHAERAGCLLRLTRAEAGILFTIAQERGEAVPVELLVGCFSRSQSPANTARVLLTRIRKKLGEDCPIETVHGRGYRWLGETERP